MKTLLFLLLPVLSIASWQVGIGTGAYLGQTQMQAAWISEEHEHAVMGYIGYTRDPLLKDLRQIGASYQWAPVEKEYEDHHWVPFTIGPFITYTDHPNYYFNSHDRYHNDRYYDITNTRYGVRFGTHLVYPYMMNRPMVFSLDASLLDRAFINFFNNPETLDIFKYYWSLGFSLRVEI